MARPRKQELIKVVKLTDGNMKTGQMGHCITQWEIGKAHSKLKQEQYYICSGMVLHAYPDLETAIIMNAFHADFQTVRAFEADAVVIPKEQIRSGGSDPYADGKLACTYIRLVKEIQLPPWAKDRRFRNLLTMIFRYYFPISDAISRDINGLQKARDILAAYCRQYRNK